MARKNKALFIFLIIIAFIGVAYAAFPWWGKTVVKSQLPPKWELNQLELGYPSFNQLKVNRIALALNGQLINAEDVLLNLDSKTVAITRLDIATVQKNNLQQSSTTASTTTSTTTKSTTIKTTKENAEFLLPEIDLNSIFASLPFAQLSIAQLNWQNNQQYIQVNSLDFTLSADSKAQLTFNLVEAPYLNKNIPFDLALNYQQQAEFLININNQQIIEATYTNQQQVTQLALKTDLKPLLSQLALPTLEQLENIDGKLNFTATNNSENQSASFSLVTQATANVKQLAQQQVQFDWNITSQTTSWPMTLHSNLQLLGPSQLKLNDEITVDSADVKIRKNIIINDSDISIENLLVNATASKINLQQKEVATELQQVSLQTQPISLKLTQSKLLQHPIALTFDSTSVKIKQADKHQFQGSLNADLAISSIELPILNGEIVMANLAVKDLYQSENAKIQLTLNNVAVDQSSGEVLLHWTDNDFMLKDFAFEALESKTHVQLEDDKFLGKGNLSLNKSLLSQFTFDYRKSDQLVLVKLLENTLNNDLLNSILQQHPSDIVKKVTINSGTFNHQSKLQMKTDLAVDSLIDINDADLYYDKISIDNLSLKNNAAFSNNPSKLANDAKLSVEQITLASGIKLDDLQFNVKSIDTDTIELTDIAVTIFSGLLTSDKVKMNSGNIEKATFNLTKVSLKELFEFLDIDGLTVEGQADMTLEFKVESDAFLIDSLTINGIDKGVVKYTKGESLGLPSNIAIDAMKNFHYTALEGNILDVTDSEIPIKIKMLGNNPDLDSVEPIELGLKLNTQVDVKELMILIKRLFL